MKYSIKLIGILYMVVSISCLISMWFFEGQERTNFLILGILFLLLAQVHMLEQTIINNVIRPEKIVVNINDETELETSKKEAGIEE